MGRRVWRRELPREWFHRIGRRHYRHHRRRRRRRCHRRSIDVPVAGTIAEVGRHGGRGYLRAAAVGMHRRRSLDRH